MLMKRGDFSRNMAGIFLSFFLVQLSGFFPEMAHAQGQFSPAITVNDGVITGYELRQRAALIEALGTPGDPATEARKQLIDDRLREGAFRAVGISPTDEQIDEGIAEFAARGSLTGPQLVSRLQQQGVDESTLRDFIGASLGWRELVRGLFRADARVSESDIDRALETASGRGGVRVRIAEIVLPTPPQLRVETEAEAEAISRITNFGAFSQKARELSAAASAEDGGDLGWRELNTLPAPLRSILLNMSVGEVAEPLRIGDVALVMLQLRGIQEVKAAPVRVRSLEYAELLLPGGLSEEGRRQAELVAGRVDRCEDLYGVNKGRSPELLSFYDRTPSEIPREISDQLARLDVGEYSALSTRNNGQVLVFLMLCNRVTESVGGEDREAAGRRLLGQRLSALADAYLEELRADAIIVE